MAYTTRGTFKLYLHAADEGSAQSLAEILGRSFADQGLELRFDRDDDPASRAVVVYRRSDKGDVVTADEAVSYEVAERFATDHLGGVGDADYEDKMRPLDGQVELIAQALALFIDQREGIWGFSSRVTEAKAMLAKLEEK